MWGLMPPPSRSSFSHPFVHPSIQPDTPSFIPSLINPFIHSTALKERSGRGSPLVLGLLRGSRFNQDRLQGRGSRAFAQCLLVNLSQRKKPRGLGQQCPMAEPAGRAVHSKPGLELPAPSWLCHLRSAAPPPQVTKV